MSYRLIVIQADQRARADVPFDMLRRLGGVTLDLAEAPCSASGKDPDGEESFWRVRGGDYLTLDQVFDRELLPVDVDMGYRCEVGR